MKLSEIDQNLAVSSKLDIEGLLYRNVLGQAFLCVTFIRNTVEKTRYSGDIDIQAQHSAG